MQNVNPMQLIQLMKSGHNPQQLMMSILSDPSNSANNPIVQNAFNMAKNNNISGLEVVARNLAARRGLNYDEAWAQFINYFK